MNAASVPLGEVTLLGTRVGRSLLVHAAPVTSQVHRLVSRSNENDWPSVAKISWVNGSRAAVTGRPRAVASVVANAAWLKAGAVVARAAFTRMNSLPVAVTLRYQKRSSASQLACTGPFDTSGIVL